MSRRVFLLVATFIASVIVLGSGGTALACGGPCPTDPTTTTTTVEETTTTKATTTTVAETTTTASTTTTTAPPPPPPGSGTTTTSVVAPPVTTTTTPAGVVTTTTQPGVPRLPATGMTFNIVLLAACLLVAGGTLVYVRRRRT